MTAQHDAHTYDFWNAPLAQRAMWTRIQIAEIDARLKQGGYPSADAYYWDKQESLRLRAGLKGVSPRRLDPMAYWFGHQSN